MCARLSWTLSCLGAAVALAGCASLAQDDRSDWPSYNRNLTSERFVPARAIDKDNIASLSG